MIKILRRSPLFVLLLSSLPVVLACGGGGSPAAGGGSGGGAGGAGGGASAAGFENMFAFLACATSDANFCPDGTPEGFDRAAFRDIYADPFGTGPSHGVYPEGSGSFTGMALPQCDDASVADVVTTDGDVDPSTWTCPDGRPTIRCKDGSRPVFHYRPAANAASTKWLIAISTGSTACAGDSCAGAMARKPQRFSSVMGGGGLTPSKLNTAGVLQRSEFNDYHRVILDQCNGGRDIGENDVDIHAQFPNDGQTYQVPIHHHGTRIMRALLDYLMEGTGMAPPTHVVFASQSNGSNGAYLSVDTWRTWLNEHPGSSGNVDVRLYANSMMHVSVDLERCHTDAACTNVLDAFDHGSDSWNTLSGTVSAPGSTDLAVICPKTGVGQCLSTDGVLDAEVAADGLAFNTLAFQPGGEAGDKMAEWGGPLDASCLAAHPDETSACVDPMHVMLFHLETPTYFAWSGYDRFMRSENVAKFTAEYEAWSLADYYGRLVALAPSMRQTKPGQKDPVALPGHGVWIDNSADHEGPTNTTKLDRTLELDAAPSTISLQESFRAWLDATTAHTPLCISDGNPRENPDNPMNTSHGGTPASATDCF